MPDRQAAVDVSGLSKTFRIPRQHIMTLKERALHPFRRQQFDELHALRDVSLQVLEGEFFGIAGRNGSGKSTLLKCLAGVYAADSGRIRIAGRLAPFIELGVGFNPDLTAHDNVVINGVMMGLSPRQARARFDDVIAFAELEDFLDLKLKNYSSGMQVRLAFSLMMHADAEMLLIDEVLAVGDAAFQQKCLDAFYRLREDGHTIILVTHDMPLIERFCHRALLLENGRVELAGDPQEVGQRYLELNFETARGGGAPTHGEEHHEAEVTETWIEREDGTRTDAVPHGERLRIRVTLAAREHLERPDVHLMITNDEAQPIFGATTRATSGLDRRHFEPGDVVSVTVTVENLLRSGRYYVDVGIHDAGRGLVAFAGRACDFIVFGGPEGAGLVGLEHTVEMDVGAVEAAR